MREEYQDLLQHEIDGLNSTEESERLEQLLASDSSVRKTFDELTAVQVAFNSLTEKTPPLTLRASIMNSLPKAAVRTPATEARVSVWQSFQALIFQPRPLSLVYAFSVGILVSFIAWNVGFLPEGGSIEPGLVGTMAPAGSPIIYENNISDNASLGTIHVTSRNGLVRVEIRWAGEQSAIAIVKFDPAILYATGVESVMGESSLSSMTRLEASLEYVTVRSSIDITTLVFVEGGETSGVPVVDVWISSDGLTTNKHRIPVNASK
jgi:hypothetical protein